MKSLEMEKEEALRRRGIKKNENRERVAYRGCVEKIPLSPRALEIKKESVKILH